VIEGLNPEEFKTREKLSFWRDVLPAAGLAGERKIVKKRPIQPDELIEGWKEFDKSTY
jgi:hypothetical protein